MVTNRPWFHCYPNDLYENNHPSMNTVKNKQEPLLLLLMMDHPFHFLRTSPSSRWSLILLLTLITPTNPAHRWILYRSSLIPSIVVVNPPEIESLKYLDKLNAKFNVILSSSLCCCPIHAVHLLPSISTPGFSQICEIPRIHIKPYNSKTWWKKTFRIASPNLNKNEPAPICSLLWARPFLQNSSQVCTMRPVAGGVGILANSRTQPTPTVKFFLLRP